MDVVGTASAVLGILQIGFSLAKAIRETVKDFREAEDDLKSLAEEIESTLYLVSQLDKLVVDNKKTGIFNDGGLAELNRCLKSTEQIVEALVALLTKTGVSHPPGTKIKAENLIVSRSNRKKWLGQKSRVKEKQEELTKVRLEVTTIILLRDTLQANPTANKAMQQALITAERDRRRRARARRKKQKGNPQISQLGLKVGNATARMYTTRVGVPSVSGSSSNGNRAIESFAYRAEISPSSPTADDTSNIARTGSNKVDGSPRDDNTASRKTAIEKKASGEETLRTKVAGDTINGNTANYIQASGNTANSITAYPNLTNAGSIVAAEDKSSSPASSPSPSVKHLGHQNQLQLSREAIIEEFKRQTKADGTKLCEVYQAMMERATNHLGSGESDHGLRKFLESEYAQEWSRMFGDWMPGTRPELAKLLDASKVEVEPSNLQRPSITKPEDKQDHSTIPTPHGLDIPRSAHLLVAERKKGKPGILRMNPPKRLKRPDLQRTSLIWSDLKDDTKKAIWLSLRSDFALPREFQWALHDATIVDPGPSLLTRWLVRLASRLEYKKANNDSYIVVFVPTQSNQSSSDGTRQVDMTDHDKPAGPDVPEGVIPVSSLRKYRQAQYPLETRSPPRPSPYPQAYTDERDAWDSRRYPKSPAFPQAPPVTWSSSRTYPERIPLDRIPADRTPVNRMPAERMPIDPMPLDRRPFERIPLHRPPSPIAPRARNGMSPPGNSRLGYSYRDRMYSPVRRPSYSIRRRRSESPDGDRRRPVSRSKSYESYNSVFLPRFPGGGQYGSEVDFTNDRRSKHDARGNLDRRVRRAYLERGRAIPLQNDDTESDQSDSDDELDDELDDDELYDQLLRKFTGHGVRDRETADERAEQLVREGTEGGDRDVNGNRNGDADADVDVDNADKTVDGDAGDEGVDRDRQERRRESTSSS